MRKISWFAGGVTLLASGAYVFIYLYRWEWHRALFVAVVFVAIEVALATGLVLRQLSTSSPVAQTQRITGVGPDPQVLARLRSTPPRSDHFAWLAHDLSRTHVFVTAMLGGGVLLSAGAWAVDRLAHHTAGPALDRDLAVRLGALAFPADGLVADDAELLASDVPYHDEPDLRLLLGPQGRVR
ncbi:MAG: hypothetical protein M3503_01120 [Actinomycetota bacterium]|nr:hypothetical protein [Actinomycetota bacterium]